MRVILRTATLVLLLGVSPIHAAEGLLGNANAIYKLPDELLTDFFIEFIDSGIFLNPNARYLGEIILSAGPIGREDALDCERFFSEIGEESAQIVRQNMKSYLFVCKDGSYSKIEAKERFGAILNDSIDQDYKVDANWAWYSSTGDTAVLRAFLDNYLENPNACKPCIIWSFSSNYKQNPDVKEYFWVDLGSRTEEEKGRLSGIIVRGETPDA